MHGPNVGSDLQKKSNTKNIAESEHRVKEKTQRDVDTLFKKYIVNFKCSSALSYNNYMQWETYC